VEKLSEVDDIELEQQHLLKLARQQEQEALELDDDIDTIINVERREERRKEQVKIEKKIQDVEIAGYQKQITKFQRQITIRDNQIAELMDKFTEVDKLPCQKCGINFDRKRGLLLCEDCLRQKLTIDFKGVVKGERD